MSLSLADYRLLVQAHPEPLLVFTSELRIAAASDAYLRTVGLEREAVAGKGVDDVFSDADGKPALQELRESLVRVLRTGAADAMRVLPVNGAAGAEPRAWRPVNTPVKGEDGTVRYVLHRLEDAGGEKGERHPHVAEGADRFRTIFDTTFQFTGLLAPDGTLLEANQAALDFGGVGLEDVVGKPFWECHWWTISPQTQKKLRASVREAARGRFVRYDADVLGSGGQVATIDFSLKPVFDEAGEVRELVPEGRDITARTREREAVLQESERRFRRAVEEAPVPVFIHAEDGEILDMSETVSEITGYTREELASIADWTERAYGERQEQVRAQIDELYRLDRRKEEGEYVIRTAGGEERVWMFNSAPLGRDERGRRLVISTAVDVTDRKRAEEEVRLRMRQQAATTELGLFALEAHGLQHLMEEAVGRVAEVLEVEYCKVLELLPGGDSLLLKAGVGWNEGLVGHATVGTGQDSQAGYTLRSHTPVVVEDLREEVRFSGPPLLQEHAVVSGLSVVLYAANGPYGVMGAHTTRRRAFSEADVQFLQTVANILGEAIARKQGEEALRMREEHYLRALQDSGMVAARVDRDLRYRWIYNPHPDFEPERVLGKRDDEMIPPEEAAEIMAFKREVLRRGTRVRRELVFDRSDGLRAYDMTGEPLRDEAGEVIGLTTVALDVTEQKRVEQELRRRERENARLLGELRRLSTQLLQTQEAERRRLAQELHDEVGGLLTSLQICLKMMPASSPEAQEELRESKTLVDTLVDRIRQLALDLRPSLLDDLGLVPALRWFLERFETRTKIRVDFRHEVSPDTRFAPEVETAAYRIAQEAVTNVARHAAARAVQVLLLRGDGHLMLHVIDEGIGFDAEAAAARKDTLGLSGMRERALLLGGSFTVAADPGTGTRITAELPLG